jgi:hypothetical protein
VRGEHSGPRTDVFSAGVVLWEALVGQRLFYEPGLDRGDLLHALVLKPVPRPSRLRADVPKAVDDVVKRALSRDPERRFQTALEFANALDAIGAAPPGAALAALVAELCAERLAEKDALLRAGLAAAAEVSESTPVPRALLVASPPSFGMALSSVPRPLRRSRVAWLGVALLAGPALWWTFDAVRAPLTGRATSALGAGNASAPLAAARDAVSGLRHVTPDVTPDVTPEPDITRRQDVTALHEVHEVHEVSHERARGRDAKLGAKLGPKSRRERARAHSLSPHRQATARDCDPPTYMDAAGIRHFKKDCL